MSNQEQEEDNVMDSVFNAQLIKAVHWIHNELNGEVVFAGSFGLMYNKLIDRPIHDLDVFTTKCLYGTEESEKIFERSGSGIFYVGDEQVKTFKGMAEGIEVDYMWKSIPLEYDEVDYDGVKIKIEKPKHAIEAKRQYVASNSDIMFEVGINFKKHKIDLAVIDQTDGVEGLDQLIKALQIFRKYGNPNYPTHCEHDVMYVCGIDPNDVSEQDKVVLNKLGFDIGDETGEDSFYSYRFGSA